MTTRSTEKRDWQCEVIEGLELLQVKGGRCGHRSRSTLLDAQQDVDLPRGTT